MTNLVFRHPEWFFILALIIIIGWWTRDAAKYWLRHPSLFLLARLEIELRKNVMWRVRERLKIFPALIVVAALALSAAVLATPVEKKVGIKTFKEARIGICIFDVSGSTMGDVHNLLFASFERFALKWHRRFPEDKLGCVIFADVAVPLGKPTSDVETLISNLRQVQKLTTDYGGGTHLERGIYSGLRTLVPQWNAEEGYRVESVLRLDPTLKTLAEIKPYIKPELEKCKKKGKFALIFTDALVELNPTVSGMSPPITMIELLGECGTVPFFITTDIGEGSKEIRAKLAAAVKRYGGKDYYVSSWKTGAMDSAIDDIASRIPPQRVESEYYVEEHERADIFALAALILVLLSLLYYLWKRGKTYP